MAASVARNYVLRLCMRCYAMSLFGFLSLLLILEGSENLRYLLKPHGSIADAMAILIKRILIMGWLFSPLAALIATVATVLLLRQRGEWVAFQLFGLADWRIRRWLMRVGCLITLFQYAVVAAMPDALHRLEPSTLLFHNPFRTAASTSTVRWQIFQQEARRIGIRANCMRGTIDTVIWDAAGGFTEHRTGIPAAAVEQEPRSAHSDGCEPTYSYTMTSPLVEVNGLPRTDASSFSVVSRRLTAGTSLDGSLPDPFAPVSNGLLSVVLAWPLGTLSGSVIALFFSSTAPRRSAARSAMRSFMAGLVGMVLPILWIMLLLQ